MHFLGWAGGGEPPEASEFIKNFDEKQWKPVFFENLHKLWEKFLLTEVNLNKK